MALIGSIGRMFRLFATLRRTGGLALWMEHVWGFSPRTRGAVWALTAPIAPFGLRGDPSLPPVSRALQAIGPSHVKFGQILSTRKDIVGDALMSDLRTLQDALPPFPQEEATQEIERQLGAPVDALFERFDPPIAAASIAQVHPAVTRDGRKVAVKVLRPSIEQAFARDVRSFYAIARMTERLSPKSRRLRPTDVVRHFESVVKREMDLLLEAAAGSEYGENVKSEPGFRTPEIYWDLSSTRVLTTGWVDGDGISDQARLRARGLDLSEMAYRIVRLFLRTALRDGYFHADMHPGNLKVAPDGAVVAYDFGIMGRIDQKTRRMYAEILFSYLTRDYKRGAQAHFDAGYVSREHDPDSFAQALRSIGEPIVGQNAANISMGRVLNQLFSVTERFGMQTRPELLLLQRSMVVVEGVARNLDPDFNMWEAARPEVEKWMTTNLGPRSVLKDVGDTVRTLGRLRPFVPDLAERLIEAGERIAIGAAAPPPPAPSPQPSGGGFYAGLLVGLLIAGAGLVGYAVGAGATPDRLLAMLGF
ncbi:MAG: 2-polyprenylphenol 6-hydroxylase [Pseudomonadota bacterium]